MNVIRPTYLIIPNLEYYGMYSRFSVSFCRFMMAPSHLERKYKIGVRVRVTLRLAVYRQSVRLGDKPLETHGHYFFFPQLNTWRS
jgi:hypothetical protein